jgi:glycine cleavage system regulatory protein
MTRSLILTIIGEDEPGLVEAVSRTVAAHNGNWLESRLSHMAGKFAGIARVEVPPDDVKALTDALGKLGARGLRVAVEPGSVPRDEVFTPASLELVGSDHPGIIRDISEALSRAGVNIEELSTERTAAPMSGEALFRATARLRLPAGSHREDLVRRLEQVAQNLMVDVRLVDG